MEDLDLGPLPKMHHREILVMQAKDELYGLVLRWQDRHKLTNAEYLSLIANLLSFELRSLIKQERK